jgi:alkanesulfonate monooxygenase
MTEFIWQLPNNRDGRYADARPRKRGERLQGDPAPFTAGVSDPRGTRFNYIDYLLQIARAAEFTRFDGIRIGNDPAGDEPWILAGVLGAATRRLTLLTEFDANRGSAVYAAKNAVSFQRYSGNRFAWNISTTQEAQQRRQQADKTEDAQLLPRVEEFLHVARGVINQPSGFDFKGDFFEVLNGGLAGPLSGHPVPRVYLSGNNAEAYQLSARQADVHLFDAQPLDTLQALIAELDGISRQQGRRVEACLRLDLIARDTREEAEFDAQRLAEQSNWQGRRTGDLWLALGHSDARATLVGSFEEVAEHLAAYAAAGVQSFVLGAAPHLEEAYRVGENLLPLLRSRLGAAA